MRRYWIMYLLSVMVLAFLEGYLSNGDFAMQYVLLSFLFCYGMLAAVTLYCYRKISGLQTGWAIVATVVFTIPGIGLIFLVNSTIWSENIAPDLFWAVTESMLAIALFNAFGIWITPSLKNHLVSRKNK
jgi:hypothetical protein